MDAILSNVLLCERELIKDHIYEKDRLLHPSRQQLTTITDTKHNKWDKARQLNPNICLKRVTIYRDHNR